MKLTTTEPEPPRSVNIKLDGLTKHQVEEIRELVRAWVEANDLHLACEKLTDIYERIDSRTKEMLEVYNRIPEITTISVEKKYQKCSRNIE